MKVNILSIFYLAFSMMLLKINYSIILVILLAVLFVYTYSIKYPSLLNKKIVKPIVVKK